MTTKIDLLIVGAGPAGMSAAITAADSGLQVAVVDEQAAVGGQVFRAIEAADQDPALRSGHTDEGRALAARFHATSGIAYFPCCTVWHIELDGADTPASNGAVLSLLHQGVSNEFKARRVLLATGAQERPMPIPGWTLPGVMSAGAAQILLKTSGAIPRGPTVIAGQGPLCWLIAVQLLRAGAQDVSFVETTPRGRAWRAARTEGWWRGLPLLREGMSLMREASQRKLKLVRHARNLKVHGEDHAIALSWDGGEMACRTVLLHDGLIPSTHISRALGLSHQWQATQQYWAPTVDEWGASSHPQIAIAGDGSRITGWQAAVSLGALAALDAAHRLGCLSEKQRNERASRYRTSLARATAVRPFLDTLYAPCVDRISELPDATIVCRCEEVTAGQIRAAVQKGATGPNQIKAFLRAGMGPCQGRMCSTTVANLAAAERKVAVERIDPLRPRAPFKPITVGALIGQATNDNPSSSIHPSPGASKQ